MTAPPVVVSILQQEVLFCTVRFDGNGPQRYIKRPFIDRRRISIRVPREGSSRSGKALI